MSSKNLDPITLFKGEPHELRLVRIPAADKRFRMGARGEGLDAEPRHWVHFGEDFWLGQTAVTQAQYVELVKLSGVNLDRRPSHFKDKPEHPVECVSWEDCATLLPALNKTDLLIQARASQNLPVDHTFCLPSEAQWEYACRALTETEYSSGDGKGALDAVAWYGEDWEEGSTHPAGILPENIFGLKDMHGNVWEWCHDTWDKYARKGQANEGYARVEKMDTQRVIRGGSWYDTAPICRSAYRIGIHPSFANWRGGLRLCLSSGPVEKPERSAGTEGAEERGAPEKAPGDAGASRALSDLKVPDVKDF